MADFLDILARDAKETINQGYYEVSTYTAVPPVSLKKAIFESKNVPIIAEIKVASPSIGTIRSNFSPERVARAMKNGGAVGISVLTEPKYFKGSLSSFTRVRKAVGLPILMKDIIISPTQLEAAFRIGANAVLLIENLFERKHCECDLSEMIERAHSKNLEVLLETHNAEEFQYAIESDADLVGINNRDLRTLEVDLGITKKIMERVGTCNKIVISESGIKTPSDLRFLQEFGVRAFLIGSAIMKAEDIEGKVEEFVNAL